MFVRRAAVAFASAVSLIGCSSIANTSPLAPAGRSPAVEQLAVAQPEKTSSYGARGPIEPDVTRFHLYDGPAGTGTFETNDLTVDGSGNFWYPTIPAGGNAATLVEFGTSGQVLGQFTTNPLQSSQDSSQPTTVTLGPDGNIWYGTFADQIGRMTPSGEDKQYLVNHPFNGNAYLLGIATGSDGNLWATEINGGSLNSQQSIARVAQDGKVRLFDLPAHDKDYPLPQVITAGPDGNLWFTAATAEKMVIGRITTSGKVTYYDYPVDEYLADIISGPDGNLWIAESDGVVTLMSTSGTVVAKYKSPSTTLQFSLYNLVVGSDGNVWATESAYNTSTEAEYSGLARITPSGTWTNHFLSNSAVIPSGIVAVSGQLWFTVFGRGGKTIKQAFGSFSI